MGYSAADRRPYPAVTYAEAEALLLALPRFADAGSAAYRPGLARIEALLDGMGRPERRYASIHVGGTNGKGSTASMIAAVATAAGRRVGLHTSPHLHTLRERMRLDGAPAPEAWVADAVARHADLFARVGPSFFEATVALSLLYFAEAGADLAVVEVGLGGRLDATNVLTPQLAVVTTIADDHAELLGGTLEAIAREKAGIAKPGVPLLTAAEGASVRTALWEETALRGGVFAQVQHDAFVLAARDEPDALVLDLRTPLRTYAELRVGLPGRHQTWNAVLAVRAAELVLPEVQADAAPVYAGLSSVRALSGLAGRGETLRTAPLVLADVAHNAAGLAAALAAARARLGPNGRLWAVVGAMADKRPEALAAALAHAGATVVPVDLEVPRAAPTAVLQAALRGAGARVAEFAEAAANADRALRVQEALGALLGQARPHDVVLVTGSHLAVAAARRALTPPARTREAPTP